MPTIRIPTPLRPYSDGKSNITVTGETVGDALAELTRRHPGLRPHLFDGDNLRSFVNVYLNQEDVRYLDGADTQVTDDDTLLIIPSIAGGLTINSSRFTIHNYQGIYHDKPTFT